MSRIEEVEAEYIRKHEKSMRLYERALSCFASGVTHDIRYVQPFPIYAVNARGTRKWDVDDNEYVDYVMGHGSLLLGYSDERVEAAMQDQISKAVHMGTSTELEIEWAELIQKLVPCTRGGLVRLASSGTEANMIAIRMARIFTGRSKIVIHAGCYHGTLDTTIWAQFGPPYGMCNARGIPEGVIKDVSIIPYNNLETLEEALATGDVACIVLQGNAHYTQDYVKALRKLNLRYGTVFLLDEVVSGFRYAAGGAQEYYGVTPDLATLGKIIGGGAPIGAICGKKEIMAVHAFKDDYWNRFVRISSGGTWNAQPISIIGGIAMMKIIEAEQNTIYPRLYSIGHRLRENFNDQAKDLRVAALMSGLPSENPTTVSISLLKKPIPEDLKHLWITGPATLNDYATKADFVAGSQAIQVNYLALANSGIFFFPRGTLVTCARYSEEDLQNTETAFGFSLRILKENRLIGITK